MKKLGDNKGFALAFTILLVLIMMTAIPSIYSLAFSHYHVAMLDGFKQQAYYNAHSGVEYAQFILKNSTIYNPLIPANWPKGASFTCVTGMGTVAVAIADDTQGGYNITSTGTVNGTMTAVVKAHYLAGVIDSWSR